MVTMTTEEQLLALVSGTLNERDTKRIIESILIANDRLFERIAHQYSRYQSSGPLHDKTDAPQIVRQIAWEVLTEIGEGNGVKGLAWEAVVNVRARTAIRDYINSSASTGIPGSGSIIRRKQALAKHADYLMDQTGRVVEGSELIDDYNATVANTPNASKRGIFATYADIQAPSFSMGDAYPDPVEHGNEHLEMLDIIQSTLKICGEDDDPNLLAVAKLWLGWFPDGEAKTYSQIASECKLSPMKVSALIDITRDIFQSQF